MARAPYLIALAGLLGCGTGSPAGNGLSPPAAPATAAVSTTAPTPSDAPSPLAASGAPAPSPPPPAPPEPEPARARFLAVGDVIFGRRVQKTLDEKADPEHVFRPLARLYGEVDFTFANLENPFFSGKKPNVTPPGKRYAVLWARPEHAKSLAKYKFTAVNLANNHALDQDLAGLDETLRALDEAGIAHVGAGRDLDAAWRPIVVEVRGLKIAFVGASFASKNDMGITRNDFVARIEDEARLAAACKAAREKAHFVVVTYHAGDEHKFTPNAAQKKFEKAAVKAGADIVLGGHPHVVQPAEKVDGVWVFHSLGNFIFDQFAPDNRDAVAVELRLVLPPGAARATIEKLIVHPVAIVENAPSPADDATAARILQRLGVTGRELPP